MDCTQRGAHEDLLGRYGVRGFPTVLFVNAQGQPVNKLGRRDPASVAAQINAAAGGAADSPAAPANAAPSTPEAYAAAEAESESSGPGLFTYLGIAAVVVLYLIVRSRGSR